MFSQPGGLITQDEFVWYNNDCYKKYMGQEMRIYILILEIKE